MTTKSYINQAYACGAKKIGITHKHNNTRNQDCYLVRKNGAGVVLCVCDGVGSNRYSSYGSRAACKAVKRVFKLYWKKKIPKEAVGLEIQKSYSHYVNRKYRHAAATTCVFCYLYKDSEILIGQAGDGIALILLDDKFVVFQDTSKEFVNEVYPLECEWEYKSWKIKNLKFDPTQNYRLDVLLATDGISDDVIPEKRKDFLSHFINLTTEGGKRAIMRALKYWDAPGSIDDKAVVTFSWRR